MPPRRFAVLALLVLPLASCVTKPPGTDPAASTPAQPAARAALAAREVLVGAWEAQVPHPKGDYVQLMTFGKDGSMEALLPPLLGKEVRVRAQYRFVGEGTIEFSEVKGGPLKGQVKVLSPDQVELSLG